MEPLLPPPRPEPLDPARGKPPLSLEERNRLILRRTLSAAAWLVAAWSLLLGLALLTAPPAGEGLYASRLYGKLMAAHGLLLGISGGALWRPRRGAWALAGLAAAGSLFFAVLDGLKPNWQSAALDLVFPLLAAATFLKSRPPA